MVLENNYSNLLQDQVTFDLLVLKRDSVPTFNQLIAETNSAFDNLKAMHKSVLTYLETKPVVELKHFLPKLQQLLRTAQEISHTH